jgi:hypothetical protein
VDEAIAADVVERLRARRIFASVNRRAGVYNVGVRVVIPDGREAIWDNDGSPGLEAMVLRDGVLVGFVPLMPDTDDLDAAAITEIIAAADYDNPPAPSPATPTPPPSPAMPATPTTPTTARSEPGTTGWRGRFRRSRQG